MSADLPASDRSARGSRELLRAVTTLELLARRNAASLLAGDYLTATQGSGLVFHESRRYVPGEPARRIDWLTTARIGEPYVKVHLEERQREVFVALDVSPSMRVGFGSRSKIETAVEIAATIAVSAIVGGDRLGHVVFSDRVLGSSRPRSGKTQLFRVLRSLIETASSSEQRAVAESDPRVAIHAIQRSRRGRFVIFLISDFIDHDVPDDLKYLRRQHDVSLLHVYDPVEYSAGEAVLLPGYSPEGPGDRQLFRPGDTDSLEQMQSFLRERCARHRIAATSCSTAEPVRNSLDRHFHRKRRLLA